MCCTQYALCADETNAWGIDNLAAGTTGKTGDDCTQDYLVIAGASASCGGVDLTTRLCGTTFTASAGGQAMASITTGIACDCTPPFAVGVVTNALQDTAATTAGMNRGVCLTYTQTACAA